MTGVLTVVRPAVEEQATSRSHTDRHPSTTVGQVDTLTTPSVRQNGVAVGAIKVLPTRSSVIW